MPIRWSTLHEDVQAERPRIQATVCRCCGEPLPVYCVEEKHGELCEDCQELEGDDDASLS